MKLRLRANTIRLRMTQPEVEALQRGEAVEETTRFSPTQAFVYRLEPSRGDHLHCTFENGRMTIHAPQSTITRWAGSDSVGFDGSQQSGDSLPLKVLVEKDFACLKPRDPDEDRGAFPHPLAGCGPSK